MFGKYTAVCCIPLAIVLLNASASLAVSEESLCAKASMIDSDVIDLEVIHRGRLAIPGDDRVLAVDLPSAGFLTLEISVPAASRVSPKLGVPGSLCNDPRAFAVVDRSAIRLTIVVEAPGTFSFDVGAQDPRRALGEYRVVSNFLPEEQIAGLEKTEMEEVDPNPAGLIQSVCREMAGLEKTEMEEVDPNPAGLIESACRQIAGLEKTEMEEVDPNPAGLIESACRQVAAPRAGSWIEKTEMEEVDPNPAGLLGGLRMPCRLAEGDDHGDTFGCASPLTPGEAQSGELANGWADDADVFEIVVEELTTVEIEALGTAEVLGVLFDRFGHRLAEDMDLDSEGFRLVRTLVPGRYYVRVEGSGDGFYEMLLTTSGG